jgi:hypothetical protein
MLSDRLECVTVCANYADFLRETLPFNQRHFDRYIVVTTPEDRETRDLCRHLGVECLPTDLMTKQDAFAKARGIDYGLANLRGDGWIVHLDADIWLPPQTRHLLSHVDLDPECLYGIDRTNCVGYEPWRNFIESEAHSSGHHQHIRDCLIVPPPFPLGARISIRKYGGYIPIGFFQMWHGKTNRRYPMDHGGAERTDVLHALQWPASQRKVLPELIAVHLESEPSQMGANWHGRRTRRFGAEDIASAPEAAYLF